MKIIFCTLPESLEFSSEWSELLKAVLLEGARQEKVAPDAELEVVLTTDEEIHLLNRDYRGKDRPTDVLSFAWSESEESFPGEEEMLGQIIISMDTAKRQAEEYGHSLVRELAFLGVHGFLHLMGYDHEKDAEEERQMKARQEEILEVLKISREKE